jgi:hypothetical protein
LIAMMAAFQAFDSLVAVPPKTALLQLQTRPTLIGDPEAAALLPEAAALLAPPLAALVLLLVLVVLVLLELLLLQAVTNATSTAIASPSHIFFLDMLLPSTLKVLRLGTGWGSEVPTWQPVHRRRQCHSPRLYLKS